MYEKIYNVIHEHAFNFSENNIYKDKRGGYFKGLFVYNGLGYLQIIRKIHFSFTIIYFSMI